MEMRTRFPNFFSRSSRSRSTDAPPLPMTMPGFLPRLGGGGGARGGGGGRRAAARWARGRHLGPVLHDGGDVAGPVKVLVGHAPADRPDALDGRSLVDQDLLQPELVPLEVV